MVEQRFTLEWESDEICQIYDNGNCMGTEEVVDRLNEYDAVFKSIDRLIDEEGGAIEYDTLNAAYYVFYHRVSGFQRCIPPNVILGTIKELHKKIGEQQVAIDKRERQLRKALSYLISDTCSLSEAKIREIEKEIEEIT